MKQSKCVPHATGVPFLHLFIPLLSLTLLPPLTYSEEPTFLCSFLPCIAWPPFHHFFRPNSMDLRDHATHRDRRLKININIYEVIDVTVEHGMSWNDFTAKWAILIWDCEKIGAKCMKAIKAYRAIIKTRWIRIWLNLSIGYIKFI